jgi:hypothetical protein
MYRIIGADQKEYGPVSGDDVQRWIAEHRLYGSSLARLESGTEWKPLAQFAEFAGALAASGSSGYATTSTLPVQQSNSMATLGVVLSCFSLICCGCAPISILGIVFSCIGLAQANRDPAQTGRPLAVAGIIIGVIALLETVAGFAFGLFAQLIEAIARH